MKPQFFDQVGDWWHELNPEWRYLQDNDKELKRGDGSLHALDVLGPNAFLNVLMCLWWWREIKTEESAQRWLEIVEDARWVLQKIR